jgi:hypothetical protein
MMSALVALFTIAGCVTVRSSTSPSANLAHYRTFAWYPAPTPTTRQSEFERSPAGELVRDRIARELGNRGIYERADRPDFFVAYRTRLDQRLAVSEWGYQSAFWGTPGGPAEINEYTEGTLVIDFIDPKSGQIFWRGTAVAAVAHPENPDMNKLASTVDKVMKKYPAQMASAAPRQTM